MNVSLIAYFLLRDARNAELITGECIFSFHERSFLTPCDVFFYLGRHLESLLSIAAGEPQHVSPTKEVITRVGKKRVSLSNTSETEVAAHTTLFLSESCKTYPAVLS